MTVERKKASDMPQMPFDDALRKILGAPPKPVKAKKKAKKKTKRA